MKRVSLAAAAIASISAAVSPSRALAATVVDGGSVGGQVWTLDASPYLVSGTASDIAVPVGEELRIEAGTTVLFSNSERPVLLLVEGRLEISGTKAAPVTLQAESYTGTPVWEGIRATTSGATINITGAIIRHANVGFWANGQASVAPITRSTFEACEQGVFVTSGTFSFDASTFAGNGVGLFATSGSAVTVTNTIFSGALLDGIAANGGTIRVANCTFDRNFIGVYSSQGTVDVRNSIFSNNKSAVQNDGAQTVLTIGASTFWTNGTNYQNAGSRDTIVPGVNNTNVDPQYLGPTDFRLAASSPCIDSGVATGAPDHDFDSSRRPQEGDGVPDTDGSSFDRGAYEFVPEGAGAGGAGGAAGAGGDSSGDAGTGTVGGSGGVNDGTGGADGRAGAGGSIGGAGIPDGGEPAGGMGAGGASGGSGGAGNNGAAGKNDVSGGNTNGAAGSGGAAASSGNSGDGASCGCRAVGSEPRNLGVLSAAFALVALARYRRRRPN